MWTEQRNHTGVPFETLRDANSSQRALPVPAWIPKPSEEVNASTPAPPPTLSETPLDRGSGIIPGAISAAVFIGLLLALYAVLWKCMVAPPKRKQKRKRVKGHEQTSLMC